MQIFSQLKSLGRRLGGMEAKNCKKGDQTKIMSNMAKKKVKGTETPVTVVPNTSVAVPDLNTLRQDALIQLKVDQRLKELQDNEKR